MRFVLFRSLHIIFNITRFIEELRETGRSRIPVFHCVSFCARCVCPEGQKRHWDICSRIVFRTHVFTCTNCGTPSCCSKQKPLVMAHRAFSRITISRRCRHDTRYVYAYRRAEAIFRSNMIIKSNGIRNSLGARILSTKPSLSLPPSVFYFHPVPPRRPPCRLLRSTHVLPGIRQGMHFILFSLFLSLLLLFFLGPSALTPAFTSGRE